MARRRVVVQLVDCIAIGLCTAVAVEQDSITIMLSYIAAVHVDVVVAVLVYCVARFISIAVKLASQDFPSIIYSWPFDAFIEKGGAIRLRRVRMVIIAVSRCPIGREIKSCHKKTGSPR